MKQTSVPFGLRIAKLLDETIRAKAIKRQITPQALAIEILSDALGVQCDAPRVGKRKSVVADDA